MLSKKQLFFFKLLFILLPLGLLSAMPIIFALQMKETLNYAQLLEVQEPQCPLLIYEPQSLAERVQYKIYNAVEREPEIIVIGNSLILTYRSALFHENPSAFYNAAATGTSINTAHFMTREIFNQTDSLPEVILLGFSPSDFSDPGMSSTLVQVESDEAITFQTTYQSGINVLITAQELEYDFRQLLGLLGTKFSLSGELLYGHQSRFYESGYRNDGSFRFGYIDEAIALHRRQTSYDTWLELGNTIRAVIPGDEVNQDAMHHVEQILQLAQENNVFVIGLFPSYMPSIDDYLVESGDYTYLPQAIEQLNTLFESYGFGFYSQEDLPNVAYEDELYFDGRHYSELTAAEIYLQFLADYPEILGEYSSADWIQQQIDAAENPFDFFNEVICDL